MSSRPLFNGSGRAAVDNNAIEALRVAFDFRVSTASIPTTEGVVTNSTFEAEAGVVIVLNYDIRKFGGGVETGTPTFAVIRIFEEDDSNNGTTGAVFESPDLIGGNALPRTGTFSFTPTEYGTYRISLEMRKDNNDFGAASDDWRVFNDGQYDDGGLATPTRATQQDKGRIRVGVDQSSITVTERGAIAPSKFAFTMDSAGVNSEESVRIETVYAASQNQQVAGTHIFKHKQRRNGTGTIDVNTSTVIQSATTHRTENKVTKINYPNVDVNQPYDILVTIETNSVLHTGNTPQYSGLGGQNADGVWTYFTAAASGATLTDYKTITKLATHNVDAGGSIENIGAYSAVTYAEDGNGVPTQSEKFSFIFTDDNMSVKSGKVLNSRGEALGGIFIVTEVKHEASGQNVTSWGNNDPAFKTINTAGVGKGWQTTVRVVTVTTPPAGIYRCDATAYFPGTSFGNPSARELSIARAEFGSPASASAGKDWIAPASFSTALVLGEDPIKGGVAKTVSFVVFNKNGAGSLVPTDADFTPVVKIYKRTSSGDFLVTPFVIPTVTKRVGSIGIYDFTWTPSSVLLGAAPDVYLIGAEVTVGSFLRLWAEDVSVWSFEAQTHNHDEVTSKASQKFFDPTGLFA